MLDTGIYLVTREVAQRSGMLDSRYRLADGRFVLNNRDLRRIRLTSEEFITGLQGIEEVDEPTSQKLIKEGGYKLGNNGYVSNEAVSEETVIETNKMEE